MFTVTRTWPAGASIRLGAAWRPHRLETTEPRVRATAGARIRAVGVDATARTTRHGPVNSRVTRLLRDTCWITEVTMTFRFAPSVMLCFALLVACSEVSDPSCTEKGCPVDALSARFDEPLELRDGLHTVTVQTATGTSSCQFDATAGKQASCVAAGDVPFYFDADGLFFEEPLEEVSVAVSVDGAEVIRETVEPQYQTTYPNGSECPPECKQAEVELPSSGY